MTLLVLFLAALLAFANGANDNAKGVATLVGFGAAKAPAAMAYATATTALGGLVAALLGGGLLAAFKATFIAGGAPLPAGYFAAVLVGACAWVLLATWRGLPVSTTHAILGGLVGAGLAEVGSGQIGWATLAAKFAVPLLASPVLAFVLVYLAGRPLAAVARRNADRCLCAVETVAPAGGLGGGAAVASRGLTVIGGTTASCAVHQPLAAASVGTTAVAVHWGTSGMVGFARGWNDTPKIAALAMVAMPVGVGAFGALSLVAVAMALGGLLAGRRVLTTLSERITPLPLGESLAASGVASILVGLASWRGLPVSTTHVTTGGIIGAGVARSAREVRWGVVREVAMSWLVTLPAAALLALAAHTALR
jgi:PiT family inorganic phosphate transporter